VVHVFDFQVRELHGHEFTEGRILFVAIVGDGSKARVELGEAFDSRARTRELFTIKRHAAVFVEDGNQALFESAFGDCTSGASLGLGCVGVECRTRDLFKRRNCVGTHALVGLRVHLSEVQIVCTHREKTLLWQRHHLGASADRQVFHARHDPVARKRSCRDP